MTVYNLYDGGNDKNDVSCSCTLGDNGLPLFSQPDLRVDGGYGFRKRKEWKEFMAILKRDYNKTAADLVVGDKLRLFLSPNHATLTNFFVDFKRPETGFEFNIATVEGLTLTADKYESTYDDSTGEVLTSVKSTGTPTALGGAVAAFTQNSFVFTAYPHTAKVDAIELVIVALPAAGFTGNMDVLFGRRFEMDGFQV